MILLYSLLLLVLFNPTAEACGARNIPCKSSEVCLRNIACVRKTIIAVQQQETIQCFNVTIMPSLTPTLRCIGSVPCDHNPSLSCGNVIDLNSCQKPPMLSTSDGIVQRGIGTIQCPDSLPCDSTLGCFGLSVSPIVFDCCGVCINLRLTPSIECLNFSANCSCNGDILCPAIRDTDQCHFLPVTPHNESTCVIQGSRISCQNNAQCLPSLGCVTTNQPVLIVGEPQPVIENNDRTWLTIFFIIYGVLLLLVVLGIGLFLWRSSR